VTEEKTEGDLVMPYKLTIYPVMDTNVEACAKYCAENVKSGDHLWMLEVGLSE
jgi:hypothetical protein